MKPIIFLALGLCFSAQAAMANGLAYSFQNTAFGGDNASATQLALTKAQSQDTTEKPKSAETSTSTQQTAMDRFKDNLERRILDQIAREIVNGVFPDSGSGLDEAGTFVTDEFSISVNNDDPDIVSVSIVEFATGSETSLEIPKF